MLGAPGMGFKIAMKTVAAVERRGNNLKDVRTEMAQDKARFWP